MMLASLALIFGNIKKPYNLFRNIKVNFKHYIFSFLVNRKNLAFLQHLKILHKNAHHTFLNFLLK